MGKPKKKRNKAAALVERFIGPTEERIAANDFQRAGAAWRVTPVIDTLHRAGKLSQAEYDALKHYRDTAHRAEDDAAQASPLAPERIMGGVGSSPCSGAIPSVLLATPAMVETARLERDLGQLRGLARAVAVDDVTLTQWCIARHGGREQVRGNVVQIVPSNPKGVEVALFELRFAAGYLRA